MVTSGELLGSAPDPSKNPGAPPTHAGPPFSSTPTSFRMATESMLEREKSNREAKTAIEDETTREADSTYGVKSLGHSIYENESEEARDAHKDGEADENVPNDKRRRSTLKPISTVRGTSSESLGPAPPTHTADSSPSRPGKISPTQSMSHSMTSLSLDSQAPLSSLPSSPKSYSNRSFRPSDEDSMDEGSQAVLSSSEDDAQPFADLRDSAPELIMPSIKMPSRRPFTDRGRDLGRLKILIAGDTGVGKTSLIKSIVQTCEDIVHVDPLSSNPPSIEQLPTRRSKQKQEVLQTRSTQQITEVYASTRPYPAWWSEVEETKLVRRRKSMGDSVLERNLCFVDTPGYSHAMSKMEGIETVLQYVGRQLRRSFSSPSEGESDVVGLLSGSGGLQVDVVFYLISDDIKPEDLVFLQRLAALTNIIPLVAKSDRLSPEELEVQRRSIAARLHEANVKIFTPNAETARTAPYTICSAPSDDDDNMEASLLMSPDYVKPLIPSELSLVLQKVLAKETVSCLRHLAAKKLLHAHHHPIPATGYVDTMYAAGMSPYQQARISDHTQQEEKLAQIRLAKWASDLQRSLQTERASYEAIAQEERTTWLTDKLGECIGEKDGHAGADSASALTLQGKKATISQRPSAVMYNPTRHGLLDAGDPLGLLKWNEALKRRGWVIFQVVGISSVIGAMAMWAARTWVGTHGEENWMLTWLGMR